MTATTKAMPKVDLRKAQEQVEDRAKIVRDYSRKAALVYLGVWGMAYDNGRAWWDDGKKFIDKAEKRGLKMEREITDYVKEMREDATGEVRKVRERIEHRVETISKEVTSRGEAMEKEVQKALEKVKPAANGKSVEVGAIAIQVSVTEQAPVEGYDEMNVDEVSARLETMDAETLAKVRAYEAAHKNRVTVLREIDAKLEAKPAAEPVAA